MRKCQTLLLSVAYFIATTVYADAASDALTKMLLNIHTMQAHFTQTVQDKSTKTLQRSEGEMSLSRPGKFRWDTQKPVAQLIIANDNRLWIYDADLEQVTVRAFHKAAGQTPALLLSDQTLKLGDDFTVRVMPTSSQVAGSQVFQLTAKDKDNTFASMQLAFVNQQISDMRLTDRLNHTTTIHFQQVKTNQALPASLFVFKPTTTIDVIDETKHPT